MDFITDIKNKGCQLRLNMSSVETFKSSCEIYAPNPFFGGWWLVETVWSDLTLKESSPSAVLKDLEKNYVESEMNWRLDFKLKEMQSSLYLKD
jgi:hypothetical protein